VTEAQSVQGHALVVQARVQALVKGHWYGRELQNDLNEPRSQAEQSPGELLEVTVVGDWVNAILVPMTEAKSLLM
jgi:hypothetical protein